MSPKFCHLSKEKTQLIHVFRRNSSLLKHINVIVKILFMAPRMVYCSIINLLWSLMSKISMMFRSVSYGPCSRTGVTCVASDFGRTHLRH